MRLNRGTLVLIVALLVVIVVVLVVNTNQMSAPGVTPTASDISGALLPNVPAENIVRYEVRDNNTGQFTALTKDSGGAWHVDGTNALTGRDPDQSIIGTTAGQMIAINYSNKFASDGSDLTTFGLDHPTYTVLVLTSDGTLYTIYIGAKSPTSARYYTILQSVTGQATPEVTNEAGLSPDISATEDTAGENSNEEGVVPPPADATSEVTKEAAASKRLLQATEEPTVEVTVGSDDVSAQSENGGAVSIESAPTAEAMPDLSVTSEATAEVTMEPTANLIGSPQVTLSGAQTIYLIPQTVIDTLKNWLNGPPYAPLPTGVPTDEAAIPEPGVEGTDEAIGVQGTVQPTVVLQEGADSNLIPEGTPLATLMPTEEATAEITPAS